MQIMEPKKINFTNSIISFVNTLFIFFFFIFDRNDISKITKFAS